MLQETESGLSEKCLKDLEAYAVVEMYPPDASDEENKAWFLRAANWASKHPTEKSQAIAQAHAVFGRAKKRGYLPGEGKSLRKQ